MVFSCYSTHLVSFEKHSCRFSLERPFFQCAKVSNLLIANQKHFDWIWHSTNDESTDLSRFRDRFSQVHYPKHLTGYLIDTFQPLVDQFGLTLKNEWPFLHLVSIFSMTNSQNSSFQTERTNIFPRFETATTCCSFKDILMIFGANET